MDVRFINPFLNGTVSVLKTMAFVEPKAGKPFLKKDSLARGDVGDHRPDRRCPRIARAELQ